MFKIFDGREYFYQWDIDRKLIVSDSSVEEVHFCNRFTNCSLVVDTYELEGITVVDVPNIILQESLDIHVYAYDEKYTKFDDTFKVKPRTRPADYVYTQEEIKVWDEMEKKVIHLEYLLGEKGIDAAIADYLQANPVEPGASEEEAAQIEQNKQDIAQLQEAASTHATTTYVDEAIGAIPPVDFTGYATEEFVSKKIAEAQLEDAEADLNAYYTKSEVDAKVKETADAIPSIEGLASETYVDEAIAAIPPVSFEGYATEKYVGEQIAAIPPVDFTGYATEAFVEAAIEDIPEVDLSDYALKSELPSTVGLATEEYVNQQIGAIEIPEVDFTGYATEGYVDEKVGAIEIPEVPTKVSAFENDAQYLTEHQSLENYYNKEEVNAAIAEAGSAVEIDGLTIIQNEDGTISTTIGGSVIDVYGKTYAEYSGVERGYSNYGYIYKNQFLTDNEIFYADAEVGKEYWLIHTITTRPDETFIVKATLEAINEDNNGIGYTFVPIEGNEYISDFGIVWNNSSTKGVLYMYVSNSFDTENDKVDSAILCEPITKGVSHIKVEAVPVDGSTIVANENNTIEVNKEMFATKEEIPSLDGYAKTEDIPSLEGYAKTEDIPDVSGYQTAEQVSAAITAAAPDLTGYATTGYVDEAVGAIDIPETDLSNYYTKEEVDNAVAEVGGSVDTSDFLVDDLPVESFQHQLLTKAPSEGDTYAAKAYAITRVQVSDLATALTKMIDEHYGVMPYSGSWEITQEILDTYGLEAGYDFINNTELTAPINIYSTNIAFVLNKKVYRYANNSEDAAVNLINYFNRIWFDNRNTGLSSTDIQSAIKELKTLIPEVDLSNYYTKEEVDSAILNAGSEGEGVDLSALATKEELKNSLYYNQTRTRPIVLSKNWDQVDGATINGYINLIEMRASSADAFWGYVKQGYMTTFTTSGQKVELTQEILDANGWTLGQDFINKKALTVPTSIYGNNNIIFWVFNNTIHLANNTLDTKKNIINYFNRIWFDNTTSGLTATDIPAAINELKTLIPDVSNYYTKTEVDTAISDALAAIGIAEEGTY